MLTGLATSAACLAPLDATPQTSEGVTVRHVEARSYLTPTTAAAARANRMSVPPDASSLAMAISAVDDKGKVIACQSSDVRVEVEVSTDDGATYTKIESQRISLACAKDTPTDIALVLDNSGSQQRVLDETKLAAKAFASAVLDRKGRVSVTRVSTQAVPMLELGDDRVAIDAAIDSLFVGRGWTALYDGVRRGHETLGKVLGEEEEVSVTKCQSKRRGAVVLMTNGTDNNSADELLADDSDGFPTTAEHLRMLNIQGVRTPLFSIGVGKDVDAATLRDLSKNTGGRYISVDDINGAADAFDLLSDFLGDTVEVCADLPPLCGPVKVRVNYEYQYDAGKKKFESVDEYETVAQCPIPPPEGRTAAILLTLTNPGISTATRDAILKNTVDWVSPVSAPSVLFVRDDSHENESADEVTKIRERMRAMGYTTSLLEEPKDGLRAADIKDYDVVWFSNPGWPMDDLSSYNVLQGAVADGVGVVLSGDDMSWSLGNSFSMSGMTHLDFVDNGASACGATTNNNSGSKYTVTFENSTHPMVTGLARSSFAYGDDIDHTTARNEGEEVLAWATFTGKKKCEVKVPVVVAYDPVTK